MEKLPPNSRGLRSSHSMVAFEGHTTSGSIVNMATFSNGFPRDSKAVCGD